MEKKIIFETSSLYRDQFRVTGYTFGEGEKSVAIVGNILVYHLHLNTPACHEGDNLSMFYISPYYPTQLPLLGAVQEISYPLFVVCYLLFFNGFSLIVWGVTKLIRRLSRKTA